jgi:hypothetical protein
MWRIKPGGPPGSTAQGEMMQRHRFTMLLIASLVTVTGVTSAATPTAQDIVLQAVAAAETGSTMADHDMIRIAIHQEETLSDGTSKATDTTAIVHGSGLANTRLILNQGVILALSGNTGWALIGGTPDTRPQTPRMAAGTIRQSLFPLLMPFSLHMQGVNLGAVTATTFDGTPAWQIEMIFDANFFASPAMLTPWRVFISRADHLVLGAEYLPIKEFLAVVDKGIRYRYLKRQEVDGINLAAQVLLDGIDINGVENGHVRVTKLTAETIGPLDLSLFINPDKAEAMETGEIQ